MLTAIGWLIAGLIVGAIARLLMPGRQSMGIFMTMVLGIVGALVGGGISWMIWGKQQEPFSQHAWPGYILATLGAIMILWLVGSSTRRTA
jgi:uncharacterized membrane protein YeaQ/YmgE (transglycosylase-associated protein family)